MGAPSVDVIDGQLVSWFSIFLLGIVSVESFKYQRNRRNRIIRSSSTAASGSASSGNGPAAAVMATSSSQTEEDDTDDEPAAGLATTSASAASVKRKSSNMFAKLLTEDVSSVVASETQKARIRAIERSTANRRHQDKQQLRLKQEQQQQQQQQQRGGPNTPSKPIKSREEVVHLHDFATSGLLEDVLTFLLVSVDKLVNYMRSWLFWFSRKKQPAPVVSDHDVQRLKELGQRLEQRNYNIEDIVKSAGYPISTHEIRTADGYLLSLNRVGRPRSRRVLLLVHGIFDSAFTWVASGTTGSLAYRAYDAGFDVFLGNFRGTVGSTGHERADISSRDYWDFCLDDHATKDIPAMIQAIQAIRRRELSNRQQKQQDRAKQQAGQTSDATAAAGNEPEEDELTVLAHSMGAGAVLAYLVQRGLEARPHGLSRAILMSPGGLHKTAPLICRLLGPCISLFLHLVPSFVAFSVRSLGLRKAMHKLLTDMNHSSPVRALFLSMVTSVLGGQASATHPIAAISNLSYWVSEGATSRRVFQQFWRCYKEGRFQAFDYGPRRNVEMYGTEYPLIYTDHYHLIDIPCYFAMGLKDDLIKPVSVIAQYQYLLHSSDEAPSRTFLKAMPHSGHIELTMALDDEAMQWILKTLHSPIRDNRTSQ